MAVSELGKSNQKVLEEVAREKLSTGEGVERNSIPDIRWMLRKGPEIGSRKGKDRKPT